MNARSIVAVAITYGAFLLSTVAAPAPKAPLDIIIASYESVQVWFGQGHGRFQASDQGFSSLASTTGVALGDLDGDGDLDLFVTLDVLEANRASPNRLLLNYGKGRFTDSGRTLGNAKSRNIAVGTIR